ncbi:Gfo/Idh/MocA family protein [Muricoccus radiodurans]|uniref:Gfo/Idh/MocA family protein n=1 Tax=Muricoccus radiodurans TaxID=2231721 RepID=UPI003CEDD166
MQPVHLAVVGAGLIGRRHAEHILAEPEASLDAVLDPSEAGRAFAEGIGAEWFPDLSAMLASGRRPEGAIIATPNQLHVANGLACVAAGIPCIVEKPLADDVAGAERLVAAAEAAGVPLLTGHHRRYNPMIAAAKRAIEEGRLGRVLTVQGSFWLFKPDDYFDAAWRREKGAGPVLLNLIHDVDLLRHLCGEVESVTAHESNAVRGHAVEDTAAILLRFANGVLGTMSVSDTVVAPWSWEMTTGENPAYPHTDQACYQIGGTHASLSIPSLDLWRHRGARSWWAPIQAERLAYEAEDPLRRQVRHLCRVVRGTEAPLVSGREGLETLRVIEAVKRSAATGRTVALGRAGA